MLWFPLNTLEVISWTIFAANHLTGQKTQFTANQTATKLQHRNLNNIYKKPYIFKEN